MKPSLHDNLRKKGMSIPSYQTPNRRRRRRKRVIIAVGHALAYQKVADSASAYHNTSPFPGAIATGLYRFTRFSIPCETLLTGDSHLAISPADGAASPVKLNGNQTAYRLEDGDGRLFRFETAFKYPEPKKVEP